MNRIALFLLLMGFVNGLLAQTIFGNYHLPAGAVPEKNSFTLLNLSKDSTFNGFWCFDKKGEKVDVTVISGKFTVAADGKSLRLFSKQMLVVDDVLVTINNRVATITGFSKESAVANHSMYLETPTIEGKKFILSRIHHPSFGEHYIDLANSFTFKFSSMGKLEHGQGGCRTFTATYQYDTRGKLNFNNLTTSNNACSTVDTSEMQLLQITTLFFNMLKQTTFYEFNIDTGILKLYDKRKKLLLTFGRNLL